MSQEKKKEPSVGTLMWRNMKARHTDPRFHKRHHRTGKHPGKVVQEILSERRRQEAAQ